jgi:uncharacterized damage-inducible protein DinB
MRSIERLMDQLNATFDGKAAFGTPLRTALDGVTEEQAKAHPIAGAHSILEIIAHAGAWIDAVGANLRGENIEPTTVVDWSDVTTHSLAKSTEELHKAHSRLLDALARLKPEQVDQPVAGKDYTARESLGFVMQHNIYHAGQIALLKKG